VNKRHRRGRWFVVFISLLAALSLSIEAPASAATIRRTNQSINTILAVTDRHCLLHLEFGSIYGAAYAKIRLINFGPNAWCLVRSQVIAIRGTTLTNGPWTAWSLLGGPSAGLHVMGTDWMQSTLTFAVGFGARYQISTTQGQKTTVETINVAAL
jgi:hypothetical protein